VSTSETNLAPAASGPFSIHVDGPAGVVLSAYLARPAPSAAGGAGRHGLVLCHGFPVESTESGLPDRTYHDLADRLAADTGWVVLTFSFRGTARSTGNFSLGGWLADLQAATDMLIRSPGVDAVWACGFAAGGTLSLCAAGEDHRIRGVAAFSAPADFAERAVDARRFVAQARAAGVIRDAGFPPDLDAWARELREVRPLSLIGKIPPRPILLVHGGAGPRRPGPCRRGRGGCRASGPARRRPPPPPRPPGHRHPHRLAGPSVVVPGPAVDSAGHRLGEG
jgi:alpha/beta superfamily hydrolase